jgi:hypothetical protein
MLDDLHNCQIESTTAAAHTNESAADQTASAACRCMKHEGGCSALPHFSAIY